MKPDVQSNIALTRRIAAWLTNAGVSDPDLRSEIAVDWADVASAAAAAERQLAQLLRRNPRSANARDVALRHLGEIEALLFGELVDHLRSLRKAWPKLLRTIASNPADTKRHPKSRRGAARRAR